MKKFYLGMDIGTESVGIACTDENYNLLRAKGKDLWSVRLFDEAMAAQERRAKRVARRRLQRRRQRIELLQGVFAPFMEDKLFFLRLNNSGFYEEDKDNVLDTKFSLFADDNYTDADFYKAFPTIFHLRRDLVNTTNKKIDLRHYYLALHHIIKYRGHFLFEGENSGEFRDVKRLFAEYNQAALEADMNEDISLQTNKAESFKAIALEKKGLNDKKKGCVELFEAFTAVRKEWIYLVLGASVSPRKLFGEQYEEKYKEEKSLSFKGLSDEEFDGLAEIYNEDHFLLLTKARAIYNFIVFERVLDGSSSISEAMVLIYNKHRKDLCLLKKYVKCNYDKEVYYQIFRSRKESANYVNYIGYNQSKNKKQPVKKCKTEDFYKFLKKTLSSQASEQEIYNYIIKEIENESFLPKILNADNGLFPHQINGMELDLILRKLCQDYPVFDVVNEDGFSLAQKIKSIFLFKIPYYVGPLNAFGKNAWMKRNPGKTEKITPWNFDDVVDKAASNQEFIRRMTNKCSFLRNQDVLPKGSMYYQAFNVLNQINKLTINGSPISIEMKQDLFRNVFLTNKKVTAKGIVDYLVLNGACSREQSGEIVLGGFDKVVEFKANMNSYVTFKQKFGKLVDDRPEIFENIIFWHTINTDKNLVEEMILKSYKDVPAIKDSVKWLKGLTSFKEFGSLSQKLLVGLIGGVDIATGKVKTILNCLYDTNDNFEQILYKSEYSFMKAIEQENSGLTKEDITYEDVESLYVSPMVRRGIWQALQMTDEYVKAIGRAPDKIFIEVTREDKEKGDKGRKISRKSKILDLYNGLESDCREINDLINELNREDMTDSRLRQERLYLYFLQLGRCVYSGERIDLGELGTDLYDVDHIIPQSITKDDSIDNKVLVKREKNAKKADKYPLEPELRGQLNFWKQLKSKGLMSAEKFARLSRIKPLTADDFNEFINRQLVITNQTAKAVAELLKLKYEADETKIVYSKAKNVDGFKQKYNIVKCRDTNDLHHARDAYLNVVVGNVYDTKFTSIYERYYRNRDNSLREYNLEHMFDWKVDGAWAGAEDVKRVKGIVSKTSISVTRHSCIDKGRFYKETILRKNDKSVSLPRKNAAPYNLKDENGLYRYGGYSSIQNAYFVALECTDGKKRKKLILGLPIIAEYQINGDKEKIKQYFEGVEGLKNVKILVAKIKKGSLISYNGYKGYIVGASDKRILLSNAVQWFSSGAVDLTVKAMSKLLSYEKGGKLSAEEQLSKEFYVYTNRFNDKIMVIDDIKTEELYDVILKQVGNKIYQSIAAFQTLKSIMEEKKGLFMQKNVFDRVKCLMNIVGYLRRGNCNGVDLTLLGESKSACALRVGYEISKIDFAIIHQSPCGLVERVQKI